MRALLLGLPETRGRRRLVAAFAVDTFGTGLFLPLAFFYFTRSTPLSASEAGLAMSLATLAALAAAPAVGGLTDRWGAKWLVVASNLVTAIGYSLYPAAHSGVAVFGCVAVVMIADRAHAAAWPAWLGGIAGRGELDSWFALSHAVGRGALGIGALASSLVLLDHLAGRLEILVYLNAASSVIAAALTASTPAPARGRAELISGAWASIARDRPLRALLLAQALLACAWTLPVSLLPLYMTASLHLPAWQAPLLFGLNAVLLLIAQTSVTRALTSMRRTRAMVAGASLYLASLAALASAELAPLAIAAVAMVVYTAGEMCSAPSASAMAMALAPRGLRGRTMAVFQLSGCVAYGLGPGLVGFLLDRGDAAAFLGLATCVIAGAAAALWSERLAPAAALWPRSHHEAGDAA